jgi:phosphoribosyl-AMP cyclohydrolase
LIPCVTTDFEAGGVLMDAYMNREALAKSIELGEAVCPSG